MAVKRITILFKKFTPNWPVAFYLLLIYPLGTLYLRLCGNIFKRHLITHLFKLIWSSCAALNASV